MFSFINHGPSTTPPSLSSQNLMVRVAKYEDVPENFLNSDSFLASRWGLVFLDAGFNKVGEMELTPDRFNGRYIFGDSGGIWISTDHPENPDMSEDFLRLSTDNCKTISYCRFFNKKECGRSLKAYYKRKAISSIRSKAAKLC